MKEQQWFGRRGPFSDKTKALNFGDVVSFLHPKGTYTFKDLREVAAASWLQTTSRQRSPRIPTSRGTGFLTPSLMSAFASEGHRFCRFFFTSPMLNGPQTLFKLQTNALDPLTFMDVKCEAEEVKTLIDMRLPEFKCILGVQDDDELECFKTILHVGVVLLIEDLQCLASQQSASFKDGIKARLDMESKLVAQEEAPSTSDFELVLKCPSLGNNPMIAEEGKLHEENHELRAYNAYDSWWGVFDSTGYQCDTTAATISEDNFYDCYVNYGYKAAQFIGGYEGSAYAGGGNHGYEGSPYARANYMYEAAQCIGAVEGSAYVGGANYGYESAQYSGAVEGSAYTEANYGCELAAQYTRAVEGSAYARRTQAAHDSYEALDSMPPTRSEPHPPGSV